MKNSEQLKEAIEALGGEFELVRELGKGATAVVYLLRDHALDRDVAMKVIRATVAGGDEALARLQREAKLVAQLTHPNIVKLYGTHRLTDGSFALFMEHVPGRDLKEILREEGAFPVPKAVRVLRDVGSALAYAHRRRIVHRDVKPENIYIDEEVGAARLADFGVARPWDQDARLTLPGASLGTPAYMSPEQIDGMEVDGRSDVYSLGLVGYEMLLGHHPWEGENVFTIIYRQKNDDLPIEPLNLGLHPILADTLETALKKDPSERQESAAAFLEQLSEMEGSGDFGAGKSALESRRVAESLAPVDWGLVTDEKEDVPPVTVAVSPETPPEDPGEEAPILVAKPEKRKGRWLLAAIGVLAVGTFGLLQWRPWEGGATDPGAFVPTASPPSESPEAVPSSGEVAVVGPTGLLPAADSALHGPVGALIDLNVRALQPDGEPLAGDLVEFQVTEGNGILETEQAVTDEEGFAQAALRLPNRPGEMMVLARAPAFETMRALIPITVEIGPPRRVVSILGEGQSAQTGSPLPEALGVQVVDGFGNRVPGTEVRFQILQGGGSVSPTSSRTDDRGRAFARWTLGSTPGTQFLAAVVPGVDDALLTFQASATAPPRPEPEREPEPPPPEEDPPGTPRTGPVTVIAKTFAVGGSQVCHLVEGSVICRGANDRGQGGDRSLNGLVGLSAGVSHGCGLDVRGGAWCWGANESGQLGDGSTTDRRPAAAVATDARFSVLEGGSSHTCGLAAGGQAVCWGRNVNGQLGTGSRDDSTRPVVVAGEHSFQDLALGWNHTCGITPGGGAYCWGSNSSGQIGDGSEVDRLVPTPVPGSFQSLATGARHTCGISGGDVLCWGNNDFGQLGDGTTAQQSSPVAVSGLPGPAMVLATGAVHTCAILIDRSAFCWGQNLHGQLGDGTTQNRSVPVAVSGGIEFVALYAGGGATCGFARDGSEYCWGLNQNGQLGDGSRTNRASPTRVGGVP